MIRIVVDSTADLPPDLAQRHHIVTVPVLLEVGGTTLRDGVDIDRDAFYRLLVESPVFPRTAAPPIGAYEQVFRELTRDGSAIISISVAGALSATYNAARQGAALVEDAQIVCVDGASLSMPLSYLAVIAAEMAQAGEPIGQIVARLEQLRQQTIIYFGLDTLTYLERGGRIGKVRAMLASMLHVKPILEVSQSAIQPIGQVRTSRRIPARLVELALARGRYRELSALYTTHRADAEALADLAAEAGLMPRERIRVGQVNSGLGTHAGPGALGLAGLLHE